MVRIHCKLTLDSFLHRCLSSEEEQFIDFVHKDIGHFLKCYTKKSVLLFPPLSSFHRLLIHKAAEEYQQLHTFSVGQGQSRRTTVCLWEDLNNCSQKGEVLMSLNRPPSARGRGRGRWSSPGSEFDNKLQNRPRDGLGREDGYNDGQRTEDRHNDHLRTDDRHDQKSPRGVDVSPISHVPSSQRGRGQKTRTRNKRPDAQIYVPRGRRQQQVPVNQHDDTREKQPHSSDIDSSTGTKCHAEGDMDLRNSDGDGRTGNIGNGKWDMDLPNSDVESRTGNIGHGKGDIDLHSSDGNRRAGSIGHGLDTDLCDSNMDSRTENKGQGHGKGDINLRYSNVDNRTGNVVHMTRNRDLHNRDTKERMMVIDGETTNRDLHKRGNHPPSTNLPTTKQASQLRKSRHQNQMYVPPHHRNRRQEASSPSHQEASSSLHQEASSLSHQEVSGPSHQGTSGPPHQEASRPSYQETSGPSSPLHQETSGLSHQEASGFSHQVVSGPSHQEVSGPSHQETSDLSHQETSDLSHQEVSSLSHQEVSSPSHQETSDLSHQANCDPGTHFEIQDMEAVYEFRSAEFGKSEITGDPHHRTKVKRIKLNNSLSKLKSGDERETEQKRGFVSSDVHNEQCSLSSDPSPSLPGIQDPSPSESAIHNPVPGESVMHNLALSESDIHMPGPSESDIPMLGPSESGIHVPGPSESDMHDPGPSESDIQGPGPSESDIHDLAQGESDIHDLAQGESDIHMPRRGESDIHDLAPGESDIQNPAKLDIPSCGDHSACGNGPGDMVDPGDRTSCDRGEVEPLTTNPDTPTDIINVDKTSEQKACSQSNKSCQPLVERDSGTLERSMSSKESSTSTDSDGPTAALRESENDGAHQQTVVDTNFTENVSTIKTDHHCKAEQVQESSIQVDVATEDSFRDCLDDKEYSEMASSTSCYTDNQTDGPECMDIDNELCSADEEKEEDSWDKMFDDEGECVDPVALEELTSAIGKVKIKKPVIDYLAFKPREPDLSREDMGHVIEIYDFPAELKTEDLMSAFQQFKTKGFDIKWVDDTHALGVFNSMIAAQSALTLSHPLLKVRAMSEAARQSKEKAKRCVEFLLPYKARPETSVMTARRLVTGALGLAPKVSREQRDLERQKLRQAKEKKKMMKKQKEDIWEGTYTWGNSETS